MSRVLLLVPTGHQVGLTAVSVGLVHALDRLGIPVAFAKPIEQPRLLEGPDRSSALARMVTDLEPPEPLSRDEAEALLSRAADERLMEEVVGRVAPLRRGADVVVVEGLVPDPSIVYSARLNLLLSTALDADVVLVGATRRQSARDVFEDFRIIGERYAAQGTDIVGCILNKVEGTGWGGRRSVRIIGAPVTEPPPDDALERCRQNLLEAGLDYPVVGAIPFDAQSSAPRARDVFEAVDARVLERGQMDERRMLGTVVGAMTARNFAREVMPGHLVITPGDRDDVILASALATLTGAPLAGLLLTGDLDPAGAVQSLCARAFQTGLPLAVTSLRTLEAARAIGDRSWPIPPDDRRRAEHVVDLVARHLDDGWLRSLSEGAREPRLSPPAFRHMLIEEARAASKRIVLPEGEEPRTVAAAATCVERGIARCVLLGDPAVVRHVASDQGIVLPPGLEVLKPTPELREPYVGPMVALRAHKGLTEEDARSELGDTVVLGTMMLALDEVDGLVSGAVHTTANTVRPAFQLLGKAPGVELVSSIFFMCLPDQVLVYGDCAIVPDPDADELADIAIQSAQSAQSFGIPPRVAMISYSTGASGAGADIDKVRQATEIARRRRGDLPIDGPLQYDAAIQPEVGAKKAPGSPVAGHATVLVFPDLNTGNTTYKAVQRSAHVVSIGPMLQGLAKPVNDLSRGALVEDIVYTIALTAIQAARRAPPE